MHNFSSKKWSFCRKFEKRDGEVSGSTGEKKRLEANQKALESRANQLKEHLYKSMQITGKTKFKTDLFRFNIQKNGGQQPITILPDVEIPSQYLKYEPDNSKIREALKKGEELPFARFEEYGTHLVIR